MIFETDDKLSYFQFLPMLRVELLRPLLKFHHNEILCLPSFEIALESIGEALEPWLREHLKCQLDVAVGERSVLYLVGEQLGGLLNYPVKLRGFDHFTMPNSLKFTEP